MWNNGDTVTLVHMYTGGPHCMLCTHMFVHVYSAAAIYGYMYMQHVCIQYMYVLLPVYNYTVHV